MFTLEASTHYSDPDKRREYHRARYLARRETILALASEKRKARQANDKHTPEHTLPRIVDQDDVPDIRSRIERDRRDSMESIRLRLIWAANAGGDEGTVAKAAVAVIRFAESNVAHWTDRSLRALHRRLALADGLTPERFDNARDAIARELFIPL